MKIVIKTTGFELTPFFKKYIGAKLNSLEKFVRIFQNEKKYYNHFLGKGKPRVEAWVEIGKETKHHQKGPYFRAECQMRFPKRSLRSTAERNDLKIAITEVKDELQREIKQYKEKLISQTKREKRRFKKELKLSPRASFYQKGRIREEGV